jgi:hypothetical protein
MDRWATPRFELELELLSQAVTATRMGKTQGQTAPSRRVREFAIE